MAFFFFTKNEFHNMLKRCTVDKVEYNNSKTLHSPLKMHSLSDSTDLYNVQDVIFLCEIMENRFQTLYGVSVGYNPRKINSASKLSDCIQREKSNVNLALLTNNAIIETFEKILTGGFSSISTRLSFDNELLMPNFTQL